jgi:hypothetical protein
MLNWTAYRLGGSAARRFDFYFKSRAQWRKEVMQREKAAPGCIHHFEYLATASALIGLQSSRGLEPLHDIESISWPGITPSEKVSRRAREVGTAGPPLCETGRALVCETKPAGLCIARA